MPKPRTWTPQFVCLADTWAARVPTATEKQILSNACVGLGLKKISLDLNDDEDEVARKLLSAEKDEFGQTKFFPQLKERGRV